jgi:hypothetical protein
MTERSSNRFSCVDASAGQVGPVPPNGESPRASIEVVGSLGAGCALRGEYGTSRGKVNRILL